MSKKNNKSKYTVLAVGIGAVSIAAAAIAAYHYLTKEDDYDDYEEDGDDDGFVEKEPIDFDPVLDSSKPSVTVPSESDSDFEEFMNPPKEEAPTGSDPDLSDDQKAVSGVLEDAIARSERDD